MKIKVIGTGSAGNCYVIEDTAKRCLMIECGVPYKKLILSPHWCGIDKVDGLIVSHKHNDHALELPQFRQLLDKSKILYGDDGDIQDGAEHNFGNWVVKAYRVPHHGIENKGFIVYNKVECEKFAFFTDTTAPQLLGGVQNWLFEINYDQATADLAIGLAYEELDMNNLTPEQEKVVERLKKKENHIRYNLTSHFSLEAAIEYFQKVTQFNRRKATNIIGIHASSQYLNENKALADLGNYTHNMFIAKDGEVFEI